MPHQQDTKLSSLTIFMMSIAVCVTVANLYYSQPLLPSMGASLGIDKDMLGFIPFASQMGYAMALLFISPLGDVLPRKNLIAVLSFALTVSLFGVSMSNSLWLLLSTTFLVGVSANITQQIIPLAASLSSPENKGKTIATIMTGLTLGILLSRTVSGSIAEYSNWQTVYFVAALLSTLIGIALYLTLPNPKASTQMSYPALIGSMYTLIKAHPLLRESAITGALWFAAFNGLWATIAIHVSEDPFSYNVQQAGLFGFVGVAGIMGAKISGRLVNRYGTSKLIAVSLVMVVSGFVVMALWGNSLIGLIIGIVLLDMGVFGAQIPNQVRIFNIDPKAQSRINAVYMLFYYIGAAVGSAVAVSIIEQFDWIGLTVMGITLSVVALVFHLYKNSHNLV